MWHEGSAGQIGKNTCSCSDLRREEGDDYTTLSVFDCDWFVNLARPEDLADHQHRQGRRSIRWMDCARGGSPSIVLEENGRLNTILRGATGA